MANENTPSTTPEDQNRQAEAGSSTAVHRTESSSSGMSGSRAREYEDEHYRRRGATGGRLDVAEEVGPQLGTAVIAAAGVALFQKELVPAVLIGAAATLAPKLVPALGVMMRPLVKTVVRAGYSVYAATLQVAAEGKEQVQDMIAEVKAESQDRHARREKAGERTPDRTTDKAGERTEETPRIVHA